MQRTSFHAMPCPIARALDRVGEWWSILILRNAFRGMTRFDQFQKSLGIAPNILSRRLSALVEAGLLEKVRYSQHPPRDEYVLTPVGQDFRPVLWALLAWGNKHFMPDGQQVVPMDGAAAPPGPGAPSSADAEMPAGAVMPHGGSDRRQHPAWRSVPRPDPNEEFRRQS
ncbi:MAG TPA: helix-turn-helix domain-containing protein [Rhodopila sp.]